MLAHEESIWCVSWTTNEENVDSILSGAVDDLVKCWKW